MDLEPGGSGTMVTSVNLSMMTLFAVGISSAPSKLG